METESLTGRVIVKEDSNEFDIEANEILKKNFIVDYAKTSEAIKEWTGALKEKAQQKADEEANNRWKRLSEGLRNAQKARYINKFMESAHYSEETIREAVDFCIVLNIPFKVDKEGIKIELDKCPKSNIVQRAYTLVFDEYKVKKKIVEQIREISYQIPSDGISFINVKIEFNGETFENKEITNLYYKKDEELRFLKIKRDILAVGLDLIKNGEIKR